MVFRTAALAELARSARDKARSILGKASKAKTSGWYKTISDMETVARDIFDPARLTLERPPYRDIRAATCNILKTDRIHDAIRATYSRLLVDEYHAIRRVADFAANLMTGTSPDDLMKRLATIAAGRSRKEVSALEQSALDFLAAPTYGRVAALLATINNQTGVRVHRPAVLRAFFRALNECAKADGPQFRDTAVRVRKQYRIAGRSLPKGGVGSTLLLKGLEAEVCVVVEGDKLNAKNLYVALTRGSNKLVICSKNPVLPIVN